MKQTVFCLERLAQELPVITRFVVEISWNRMQSFLLTHTYKPAQTGLAKCCSFIVLDLYYYFFLSVLSSQSVGMGSQPMGVDRKDGLTVVACMKDVSVYSLYQRLHFLNYHSMVSQCMLIAHSNGSVFFIATLVNEGEWL